VTDIQQADLILAIAPILEQREGFRHGDPWRPSDDSLVALLPILRDNGRVRKYLTFPEAIKENALVVTERGWLNSVHVENRGDEPVLLRAGDIIAGSTQERTFVKTQMLPGLADLKVEVVCVHQTRPLAPGTKFTTFGDISAPYRVRRHFYRRGATRAASSQSVTWTNINAYALIMAPFAARREEPGPFMAASAIPSDDLTRVQREYAIHLRDLLKDMPLQEAQVGLAVLDLKGCQSIECFDAHQSFEAMREALVSQSEAVGQKLKDLDSVFEYRPEHAGQSLRRVLHDSFDVETVWSSPDGATMHFEGREFMGECTLWTDVAVPELVHLLILRKE
jgi:hypothetical protein